MRVLLPMLASLLFAACSSEPGNAPAGMASSEAAKSTPKAAPSATVASAAAREVKESNELYEFEYSYPAAAGAIPALKTRLDAELDEERRDLQEDAKEQRAESQKAGFSFNPLGYWASWQVVSDLPGWLSLSGNVSSYEGGAHPNHGFDAILWDKQANVKRDAEELFASKEALSRAIRRDFCREIDRQRAKKRGAPVKSGSDEPFSDCIDPVESTVILGSSNRKTFDRIGVLVAPYEAGPYSEGNYEVTLPVTDAVLAAVKPEYRASFAARR